MALIENFNSYTDGDLNGQGSWSGHVNFDIQASVVQEGAKAVINQTGANATITKTFTPSDIEEQQFYARADTGNLGMLTRFEKTGSVSIFDLSHSADDTWHKYNVQWDGTAVRGAGGTGQYRYKVDDGAWGSWTDGVASFTEVVAITLRKGGEAAPSYWDNFTAIAIPSSSVSPSASPSASQSPSASLSPSASPSPSPSPADWVEESKSTTSWVEESKNTTSWVEESKSTI